MFEVNEMKSAHVLPVEWHTRSSLRITFLFRKARRSLLLVTYTLQHRNSFLCVSQIVMELGSECRALGQRWLRALFKGPTGAAWPCWDPTPNLTITLHQCSNSAMRSAGSSAIFSKLPVKKSRDHVVGLKFTEMESWGTNDPEHCSSPDLPDPSWCRNFWLDFSSMGNHLFFLRIRSHIDSLKMHEMTEHGIT